MPEINDRFYKGTDAYTDGEIENELFEMIKSGADHRSIINGDSRWPVYYHLTDVRRNILEWFPFREDASVLEIGAGCGAVTGLLTERCRRVVSVELSKKRAEINAARYPDADNLEIIIGNFEDIETDEKFDYVTLIGVLEYAGSFIDSENPYDDFLSKIRTYLKPGGSLIIAIENKLGLKYFAGAAEDHTGEMMDGIEGYPGNSSIRTLGRRELRELLNDNGYKDVYFYYPHPDYKLPETIYSEGMLPESGSMLQRSPNYDRSRVVSFNETLAYEQIIRNRMYEDTANSFLVVCGAQEERILFSSYSRKRKKEFQLETKILPNRVVKRALFREGLSHLSAMAEFHSNGANHLLCNEVLSAAAVIERKEGEVCFELVDGTSVNTRVLDCFFRGDKEAFIDEINKYASLLREGIFSQEDLSLRQGEEWLTKGVDTEIIGNSGRFMKRSLLDGVFSNVIYIEGGAVLIDQEWILESSLPVDFMIFRGIYYFYRSDFADLNVDSFVSMEEILDILGISAEEADEYVKMDNNFQEYVVDSAYNEALKGYSKNVYDIRGITQALDSIYAEKIWDEFYTKSFTLKEDFANVFLSYVSVVRNDSEKSAVLQTLHEKIVENRHLQGELEKAVRRAKELHDTQQELIEIINSTRQELLACGDKVNSLELRLAEYKKTDKAILSALNSLLSRIRKLFRR